MATLNANNEPTLESPKYWAAFTWSHQTTESNKQAELAELAQHINAIIKHQWPSSKTLINVKQTFGRMFKPSLTIAGIIRASDTITVEDLQEKITRQALKLKLKPSDRTDNKLQLKLLADRLEAAKQTDSLMQDDAMQAFAGDIKQYIRLICDGLGLVFADYEDPFFRRMWECTGGDHRWALYDMGGRFENVLPID